MNAAVLRGVDDLWIEEMPDPQAAPGDVLIRSETVKLMLTP
jgi:hypothetical protein